MTKGWKKDSYRHSLASKGITTTNRMKSKKQSNSIPTTCPECGHDLEVEQWCSEGGPDFKVVTCNFCGYDAEVMEGEQLQSKGTETKKYEAEIFHWNEYDGENPPLIKMLEFIQSHPNLNLKIYEYDTGNESRMVVIAKNKDEVIDMVQQTPYGDGWSRKVLMPYISLYQDE